MTTPLVKSLTVLGTTGDSYTFRIPTLYDDLRVAARVKDIRKIIDPNWNGQEDGLHWTATYALRAAATFDTQLESTSATWVYTPGPDGKPMVDSGNFPSNQVDEVANVYGEYVDAVQRFRSTGNPDKPPAPKEAVDSERDQSDVAVQPGAVGP